MDGADYIGVTAFATPTKHDAVAGGLELLRTAAATLTVPWFAIGGVEPSNVAEVRPPARRASRSCARSGTPTIRRRQRGCSGQR